MTVQEYQCAGVRGGCGYRGPYLKVERHVDREHGGGRVDAVLEKVETPTGLKTTPTAGAQRALAAQATGGTSPRASEGRGVRIASAPSEDAGPAPSVESPSDDNRETSSAWRTGKPPRHKRGPNLPAPQPPSCDLPARPTVEERARAQRLIADARSKLTKS